MITHFYHTILLACFAHFFRHFFEKWTPVLEGMTTKVLFRIEYKSNKKTVHFCGSGKNKEYLLIIFVTLIMDGEEVSTFCSPLTFVLQDWNAQYKNKKSQLL